MLGRDVENLLTGVSAMVNKKESIKNYKPPRSIIELLIILLAQVKKGLYPPLCYNIGLLHRLGKITSTEYKILDTYITKNRPLRVRLGMSYSGHWWKPKEFPPRIKWINKRLHKEVNKL